MFSDLLININGFMKKNIVPNNKTKKIKNIFHKITQHEIFPKNAFSAIVF